MGFIFFILCSIYKVTVALQRDIKIIKTAAKNVNSETIITTTIQSVIRKGINLITLNTLYSISFFIFSTISDPSNNKLSSDKLNKFANLIKLSISGVVLPVSQLEIVLGSNCVLFFFYVTFRLISSVCS